MLLRLLAVLGYVAGALVLGTLTASWLLSVLPPDSVLLEKGATKFARRCMMIWGLLLAPLFVLALGTFRKADHGWTPWEGYTLRRRGWRLLLAGFLLGLLTLGTVMLLALLFGSRHWHVSYATPKMALKLLVEYPLRALVLAIFEETVVRGYLLRGLCRGFGVWGAIALSSGLFALLHFIYPAPESFFGDGVFTDSGRALVSGLTAIVHEPRAAIQACNLFLMAAFLCLLTLRTGSIWPAAGVHAGWVWIKFTNGIVADSNRTEETPWIFGTQSDHLDAVMTAAILLFLTAAMAWSWHRAHQASREAAGYVP